MALSDCLVIAAVPSKVSRELRRRDGQLPEKRHVTQPRRGTLSVIPTDQGEMSMRWACELKRARATRAWGGEKGGGEGLVMLASLVQVLLTFGVARARGVLVSSTGGGGRVGDNI